MIALRPRRVAAVASSSTASTRRSSAAAVRMLVDEDRADHVDLNFGCPVPKVTRKGGGSGAAVEARPVPRHRARAAVRGRRTAGVPVTVKMRMGIDDDHLTYLEAGRIAAEEGAALGRAARPHGRSSSTAAQADWAAIARLVEELAPLGIPVLGNGDIWTRRRRAAR